MRRLISLICLLGLLAGGATLGTAQTTTTVSLSTHTVGVGATAAVEGHIDCAAGYCRGFAIVITFDPAVLRVESATLGPYLGMDASVELYMVDNTAGQVQLSARAPNPPPAADTLLFTLNVTGLAAGTSPLHVQSLQVNNMRDEPVPSGGIDGAVMVGSTSTVVGLPGHGNWELAFVSERDGNPEIYTMNADGSNVRRLTTNPARDTFPVWSPNGERIAFVSERDGNAEIYVMNANGSNLVRLTANPAADGFPSWAPGGTEIMFASDRDGNLEIYAMSVDGANLRRLTTDPAPDTFPSCSPDGGQVLFVSERGGSAEVYTMDVNGGGAQQMTNLFGARGWYPAWSPTGQWMSLTTERDGQGEIYIMDRDGANARPLQTTPDRVTRTAWSPDGQWIAHATERDGQAEIYTTSQDGANTYRLTNEAAPDYAPDWRPLMAAPCLVRTDDPEMYVRVGPGENRGVFTFMPTNRDFLVTGQALDHEGKVWWQLDKTQFEGNEAVNELWVAAEDVEEIGDCPMVMVVEPPPIIVPPPPTPVPTSPPPPPDDDDVPPPDDDDDVPPDDDDDVTPEPECYSLALSYTPSDGSEGTASASPPPNCGNLYVEGTGVTITAYPSLPPSCWVESWSGTCAGLDIGSTDEVQTITMNYDCWVNVTFDCIG
jgi:Tol biopolymer transport system component